MNFIDGIIFSISYFTTLPIHLKSFKTDKNFYRGIIFGLPFSGLILAIITIALAILLPFPLIYKAILCSIIYLFLYGFIHLEAVADTIDGLFASLSNKDTYQIMKEPQIGALGAIGTFSFMLLKILALFFLLYYQQYLTIMLALFFSRFSLVFALDLDFHPKSTLLNSLKSSFKPPIILKVIFLPLNILTKLILLKLRRKLGFINGDTMGFTIELIEIILFNIGVYLC